MSSDSDTSSQHERRPASRLRNPIFLVKDVVDWIFAQPKRRTYRKIAQSGEWRYPLKGGKIQVFKNIPIGGSSLSLNDNITPELRSRPHKIDPPALLKDRADVEEKDRALNESRRRDRRDAQDLRTLRRELSPHYLPREAQWQYELPRNRTQVFYCNTTELLEPGWRRASFDDPRFVEIKSRQPYRFERDYRNSLSGHLTGRRHTRRARKYLEFLLCPCVALVLFAPVLIVLLLVVLLSPLYSCYVITFDDLKRKDKVLREGEAA
jgi:hypothetical protein